MWEELVRDDPGRDDLVGHDLVGHDLEQFRVGVAVTAVSGSGRSRHSPVRPSLEWRVFRWDAPLRVAALVVAACCLALLLQVTALPRAPSLTAIGWPFWLALTLAFVVGEKFVAHLQIGRHAVTNSFSEVPLIVGLAFLDPTVVVMARIAAAVPVFAARYGLGAKFAFNVSHVWVETTLAAVVWHSVLAGGATLGPRGWMSGLAVLAATAVYSTAAIGLVMRLSGAPPWRQSLPEFMAGSTVALLNVSFAVLLVTVIHVDWRAAWTLIVLGVGLFLAYQSYSSLRRHHDTFEQLATYTYNLEGQASTAFVADEVVSRAGCLLEADLALLRWLPKGDANAPLSVQNGRQPDVDTDLAELLGSGSTRPLLLPRDTHDPLLRRSLDHAGLRDALVVPLRSDDGVRGSLLVADRIGEMATFTPEDLQVLQTIANQAAVALANSELAERWRREAADREHQALHDPLTGLANRRQFQQRLQRALVDGDPLAILLLDLDQFKEVNDTLGHHTGDRLLQQVAVRLSTFMDDRGLVARLGGDEFAILLPGLDDVAAASMAKRLREVIDEPLTIGEFPLRVDASIGVALAPDDGHSAALLLQHADVAMYAAKEDRTGFSLYSSERDRYSPRRLALFSDLRAALEVGTLNVAYQPKVSFDTGTVTGVEALVRWEHGRYGSIPPDEFIPIAEHTALMLPLTEFVLESALEACAGWDREGIELGVAINLSPRVLLEPGLFDLVRRHLGASRLAASRLTLEITEDSIVADPSRTISVLERLRHTGVRLSIDDFGTGHSSLSYLRDLPVHQVKIDKSFIMKLGTEGDPVVDATIDLAHRLELEVVAEGVETPAGYNHLRRANCDTGQGYLISRPVPAAAISEGAQAWSPPPETTHARSRNSLSVVS